MIPDQQSPCELILKIGCNESDEITSTITNLLRSCSIVDQRFLYVERQIQPSTYFGSFTSPTLRSKVPIQCQSLSCVIFLTDEIFKQHEKKEFFKSTHIWNFHHKIELLDEYRHTLARQDYYELSHLLPLWSVSHIPFTRHLIIRFNVFTRNFETMLRFYTHLFQRRPDSSKSGFVLFNLSAPNHHKILYQFSIKYSPSIESYSISQGAYLKFRLSNLNYFLHEYTSKLFTINKSEYYIHDPDGNLLHLCLHNMSSNIKESLLLNKSFVHPNDSGFGDSSDPSIHLLKSNVSQMYPIRNDIDGQSHSSNDSGQCSSISSNETKRTVQQNSVHKTNSISVRPATKSEIDMRLKQQQRTVLPHGLLKPSLYESEPRISQRDLRTRCYSSMNNIKRSNDIRPISTHHFQSSAFNNDDYDISYEVDSPRVGSRTSTSQSSYSYLNTLLQKQQQQAIHSQNVKDLIEQFEKSKVSTLRPKSVPVIDHSSASNIVVRPQTIKQQTTCDWEFDHSDILNTSDEQRRNSRINIGITLDSRLRKTPVLDMLRSTTMQSDISESQQFHRTNSFKFSSTPVARF
ncbi:unnamed protein product [Adineta ricciae]|uniref:FAM124 domain-containing protein n=1 Tax=Adineta ricciae TaxID=249248 RepID=A0A814I0A3_ADIRI|nr:unnamed protein product [Adineta ricciae]CAF1469783.1 unnamed protein product [Adineta ricciae]